MPDGLNIYKSTLTPQEVDEAFRNIGKVQANIEKAAGYAQTAEQYGTIVQQNQAAIQAIEEKMRPQAQPHLHRPPAKALQTPRMQPSGPKLRPVSIRTTITRKQKQTSAFRCRSVMFLSGRLCRSKALTFPLRKKLRSILAMARGRHLVKASFCLALAAAIKPEIPEAKRNTL